MSLFLALYSLNIFPIAFKNDLTLLIEADSQYCGFKQAKVYIQGELVPFDHLITMNGKNGFYNIEIEIPADYAAQLAGKKLSPFTQKLLNYLYCYLHISYKPTSDNEIHYLTDILIDRTDRAHYTIYPRGVLSITVYVE